MISLMFSVLLGAKKLTANCQRHWRYLTCMLDVGYHIAEGFEKPGNELLRAQKKAQSPKVDNSKAEMGTDSAKSRDEKSVEVLIKAVG